MIHIEKSEWLTDQFARCGKLSDIIREPIIQYEILSEKEKDKFRQSQTEKDEVIRVLGFHEGYALIMKWDNVLGWMLKENFTIDIDVKSFSDPITKIEITPINFFQSWKGTKYIWGGITKIGIDCSGFTQRYYLDVMKSAIPKNSYDQRKSGLPQEIDLIADHDLVFCFRVGGSGTHHVGVYFQDHIWHAQQEFGVIKQSLEEFKSIYKIEEIIRLS